jgi:putative membrane protein
VNEYLDLLLSGLPEMFLHAGIAVGFLVFGVFLFIWLTPYDDMKLLKDGNVASAISLFGIIVGLAIPLSFCLAQTSTVLDLIVWGSFTVAIQLFAFKVSTWLLSELPERIERGEISAALVLLGVKLAAALINSAMG